VGISFSEREAMVDCGALFDWGIPPVVRPVSQSQSIQFAGFEVHLHSGELYRDGKRIKIQERPFKILSILLESPGELVTREALRGRIWPADTFVDFDHSLAVAVNKIREALGDSAEVPRFIETVGRRGYRFLESPARPQAIPVLEENHQPLPQAVAAGSSRASRVGWRIAALMMTVALLALIVWGSSQIRKRRSMASVPLISSLAVLPLENLSGDSTQDYFSDGMTDELITDLAKLPSVRVISRTSTAQYKGTKKTIPQIARELNVDALVEGTVVRLGNRVRIRTQLIYAPTDQHLWAEAYERDEKDVLALQASLAQEIARNIRLELTATEQASLSATYSVDPEVHELYLKGRYFWNRRDLAGLHKAAEYFQEAVSKDPNYAEAYAGLADSYGLLGMMPEAKAAAEKALTLNGDLAEAHTSLGLIAPFVDWNWSESKKHFERALTLNPNYATAHHWYAEAYLMPMGQVEDALAELRIAQTLDPLSPVITTDLGKDLYLARRYDKAEIQLRRALELDANFVSAHNWLSDTYLEEKKYAEAVAELEETKPFKEDRVYIRQTAYLHARMGNRAEAQRELAKSLELSEGKDVSLGAVALTYAALGDREKAFSWLEKAYVAKSSFLTTLKFWTVFDPIRSDARFTDLVRRVGLNH
jgi:TolB-like protein/DNA-binding winged helix-turn-helix (wHTH) protein/Tfp pilus assembly protein PilF